MALKAIKPSNKGKIAYYYGDGKGGFYSLLRGGATRQSAVKTLLSQSGFVWQERLGMKRVMAYRHDGYNMRDLLTLLARLQHMGCEIVPSEKLNKGKHLLIGEWNSLTRTTVPATPPKTAFGLFSLNEKATISLEQLQTFLQNNGYDLADTPSKAGDYRVVGGHVEVFSFGYPERFVAFDLDGDVVESLRQYRTDTKHWAKISNCRIYGKGFNKR